MTSPESPHRGPAYASKKPIRGGGVSRYVTTRRNPLVCTGLTACKSPPTYTQGDHEGARGDHEGARGDALWSYCLSSFQPLVFCYTITLRRPSGTPRVHQTTTRTLTHTHTSTHPRGVHMVGARSTSGCVKVISENTEARTHDENTR